MTAQSVNLGFKWDIDEDSIFTRLNPHQVLNLARIVQEALTNVLKHAGASRLTVRGGADDREGTLTFLIEDNGRGIGPHADDGGRGLTSMRARASELGAELSFQSANPGTQVRLTWRLDAASLVVADS